MRPVNGDKKRELTLRKKTKKKRLPTYTIVRMNRTYVRRNGSKKRGKITKRVEYAGSEEEKLTHKRARAPAPQGRVVTPGGIYIDAGVSPKC